MEELLLTTIFRKSQLFIWCSDLEVVLKNGIQLYWLLLRDIELIRKFAVNVIVDYHQELPIVGKENAELEVTS